MIRREDILSIAFLKKSPFTGSFQGMRYRLEKGEQDEAVVLQVHVWPGPYNFEVTKEADKECHQFAFSEEGICEAVDWLNTMAKKYVKHF